MIEYVFPLSKELSSGLFHSELRKIGHLPELTHVGPNRVSLQSGLQPDQIIYMDGATDVDELNVYFWFTNIKSQNELNLISSVVSTTILNNDPEF